MGDQTRPSSRGATSTLVRSKSLRLPTSKKQSEQQSYAASSTLTRHGSMRLHRGGAAANPPIMSASYHGQLPAAPEPASKKTSSALSALRRPFQRFKGADKKEALPKAMSVSVHADLMTCSNGGGGDGSSPKQPEAEWRSHFRVLMQEHEKLQLKYARLRNQLLEKEALHALLKPPPTVPASRDLATIPEDEGDSPDAPSAVQESPALRGYHREIRALQDDVRNVQKKYWDLVVSNEKCAKDDSAALVVDLLKQVEQKQIELAAANSRIEMLEDSLSQLKREVATCHDALNDYQLEMEEQRAVHVSLRSQLEDKDAQLAEARESAEFLQAEMSTLSEAHQESEQSRHALQQDLQRYMDGTRSLYERCQKLYNKVQEKNIKILQLQAELEAQSQTHDMLLSQGAEMSCATASLTQLSLKLHSFLKMSAMFAGTQLQLDNEVLDEIMEDYDEDQISSSTSSTPSRPKELPNGIFRPSSVDVSAPGRSNNGDSNSNSSYSTPISELPSPSVANGEESLVHMVLQAASSQGHSKVVDKEVQGPSHALQNGTTENDGERDVVLEVQKVSEVQKMPEVQRLPEVGKPVGTVPPFRTVATDVNGHHKDGAPSTSQKHGSLDSLVAELTALSGKLLRVHSMMHSKVQDRLRTSQEQIEELKKNLDTICQKNIDSAQESTFLKQQLDQALTRVKNLEEKLQTVHESYRKEIEMLFQQIEDLKEKNRCLMAVNQEQARQLKEELLSLRGSQGYTSEADIIFDKFRLKQEVANLKEEALSKDEQYRSLAGKFARFKKAYEDNYQKATEDIEKLDTMIERVIETLQSVPEVVASCSALQGLLDNLTGTGCSPMKQSPIRRPQADVACHVTTL